VERYLVIRCPDLLEEKEEGRERRAFDQLMKAASTLTTRIEKVRPGVCAVPTRGPSRYFGGDLALSVAMADKVAEAVPDQIGVGIGVADGLFAGMLAARSDPDPGRTFVVPHGGTPAFLAPWPVAVLERPEMTDLLGRLGIRTLGQFASLPSRDVFARFGTDGASCHMAAAGRAGEIPGLRTVSAGPTWHGAPEGKQAPVVRQPGFWGGTAEADVRAGAVLARIQSDLGPEEVVAGRLGGGRSPSERARLVPIDSRKLGSPETGRQEGEPRTGHVEPWPGRLPAPSPAVVLAKPVPVVLADAAGGQIFVSSRVLLSSAPVRVSVAGGPWAEVVGWAGPWPADDRWWSASRRRRARVQVVTDTGGAQLLVAEGGGWWLEGVYD